MSVLEMAEKLLEKGLADFIGNGLTIEIATRGTIKGNRVIGESWQEYKTIKLERKPSKRETARPDSIRPEVCRLHPPGSEGRKTCLAAYYANLPRKLVPSDTNENRGTLEPDGESAFSNDIAEDLAQLLPVNGYRPHTVNLTGGLGAARHRRKTKKLGE